jgi:uncharacterized protein
MKIEHKKEGNDGFFYAGNDDHPQAEMTYTMPDPQKMIISHTEVSEELRGQHVGYDLVEAAVNYARDKNIKILPLCPFANAVFKKKKEYHDVLFQSAS